MAPYLDNLRTGLGADKVRFEETRMGDEAYDVAPAVKSSPSLLQEGEIEDSSDMRSLFLTVLGGEPMDASAATGRMKSLICTRPWLLEDGMFGEEALAQLDSSPPGDEVSRMIRLHGADDADLMESYYEESDRGGPDLDLLTNLIALQKRDSITGAIPGLCLREGGELNSSYFARLDPSDEQSRDVIRQVCEAREGGMECPGGIVDSMAMRSLLAGGDAGLAEAMMGWSSPSLRRFGLSWLAEHGDVGSHFDSVEGGDDDESAIAALALGRGGPDAWRQAKDLGCSPGRISGVAGRGAAFPYLRANRMDWRGDPVPRPSEIFSVSETAVPLAKNLADLEDKEGLLILLRRCADVSHNKRKGKGFQEIARIVWDALRSMGVGGEAEAMLRRMGLSFRKGRIRGADVPDAPSGEDIADAIGDGDDVGAAIMLDRIGAADPGEAGRVLRSLPEPRDTDSFLSLLLPDVIGDEESLPDWARRKVAARLLPNGMIVRGTSSSFRLEDMPPFSCDEDDLAKFAIEMEGKGRSPGQ
jgi:hypothetical protein